LNMNIESALRLSKPAPKGKLPSLIFFDPPHAWGKREHYFVYPRRTPEYIRKYKDKQIPRYYGWNKYPSKRALLKYIHQAQVELARLLRPDGLLWFKWNEMEMSLNRILPILNRFDELMKIYVKAPSQTGGRHQTYWVCMELKPHEVKTLNDKM